MAKLTETIGRQIPTVFDHFVKLTLKELRVVYLITKDWLKKRIAKEYVILLIRSNEYSNSSKLGVLKTSWYINPSYTTGLMLPEIFWCFHEVKKDTSGMKWIKE